MITRMMKPVECKLCGFKGKPKVKTRGSVAIELVLWCCLLIPGLVYSLWRVTSRVKICAHCKKDTHLIPIEGVS